MKKINTLLLYFLILGTSMVLSCKEESENIYTMFKGVKVTFHGDNPLSVTDYKLVNDTDSVYIDYTITSDDEDMYSVVEERVAGANSGLPERSTIKISDETSRRSYSRVIKLKMQRDGKTSYRVYALNNLGHYIGDGYTKVTIEQSPSYTVTATRRVFAPDTLNKVQPSFFSISRGQSFSYTDGADNSADIDFGIWRNKFVSGTPPKESYVYNYYSLATPTNPFPLYDISTWTKRPMMFSAIVPGQQNLFLYTLVSSSTIKEQATAGNRAFNVTSTNFASGGGLVAGSLVYFLTPEGKYGAFIVNQSTSDIDGNPFLGISVKMQD